MRVAIAILAFLAITLGLSAPLHSQQNPYASGKTGGNYMHNYYIPPAPSSTPWAPAWYPDGRYIAVAMSGSIWRVDPTSGVADEITYSEKYHSSPSISPDGKWLVYTADDGGKAIQLEIMNIQTGAVSKLTDDDALYLDPVFSPDGTMLAYVSSQPNGYFNVFVRPVKEGAWAGPAIAVTRDNQYKSNRLYMGQWDLHIQPSWFPDAKELLLVSNRGVPLGSGNVFRVRSESDGMDRAKAVLEEQSIYRTAPSVSPDGTRFIYSSTRGAGDQFSNLYLQPTSGGEPYKLTHYAHDAFHPRWSPDGEWIVYVSNEKGLPQLELLETFGGQRRLVAITKRNWKRPMGRLTVEIKDAGSVTPARILLTAGDGKLYAPTDSYARIGANGGDPLFFTSGRFTVELPAGPVKLLAMKGFEYQPKQDSATIAAGKTTARSLELGRIANMAKRGWYNGSTHVHVDYAGNKRNSLSDVVEMSKAEGQDVTNGLVSNKDNRVLDNHLFRPGGKPNSISTKDHIFMQSQEYRPTFWGHAAFLGLRDHILTPVALGYEGTAIASYYPSNTDMFRKARAQGATILYVHAFGGEENPLDGNLGGAKGLMVDAVLGNTDAVEWSAAGRASFFPLYALWNNGIPVYAVGGEDSISDLQRSKLIGSARTYVHTAGKGLNIDAWFEGIRKGRSFVTTGPLVELTANAKLPGETVQLPAAGGQVNFHARIRSITPLQRVLLVRNGTVVEEMPLSADRKNLDFSRTVTVRESGWYHLRAEGAEQERFPLDSEFALGFTNPIWVTVGARPIRNFAAAQYGLQWIDKLQQQAEASTAWRSDREKKHIFAQFDDARKAYRRLAAEASANP